MLLYCKFTAMLSLNKIGDIGQSPITKAFKFIPYLMLILSLPSINSHATGRQDHGQHAEHPVKMGLHGMLLFGSQYGLFASHLPMFHQPHNAQVVYKLSFVDPKIQAEVVEGIRASANSKDPVWTIVPTTFDLSLLDPKHPQHITQLTIDVVKGHFERGGKMQWQAQTINVDKMELFNPLPLESGLVKEANNHYLNLNYQPNDKVQFLVNTLTSRPDADHIVRLDEVQAPLAKTIILAAEPHLFNTEAQLSSVLPAHTSVQRIYLELGELK